MIRWWERLRGWIKEDRVFLLWRQRLGFQIAEWESSGCDKEALLRGTLLKEARRFAHSRRDDLNDRERGFLARSESQSRRRLLRIGFFTILAILGGVGFYRYQYQKASAIEKSVKEIRSNMASFESFRVFIHKYDDYVDFFNKLKSLDYEARVKMLEERSKDLDYAIDMISKKIDVLRYQSDAAKQGYPELSKRLYDMTNQLTVQLRNLETQKKIVDTEKDSIRKLYEDSRKFRTFS